MLKAKVINETQLLYNLSYMYSKSKYTFIHQRHKNKSNLPVANQVLCGPGDIEQMGCLYFEMSVDCFFPTRRRKKGLWMDC